VLIKFQDTECRCSTTPVSLGGRSDCRNKCEERNESLCSSGKSSMVFKLIKGMDCTSFIRFTNKVTN